MERKLFRKAAEAMDSVSSPIPGRESEMVKNNAGGYAFDDGPFGAIYRFVMLGIDNGTYYVSPSALSLRLMKAFEEYLDPHSEKAEMGMRVKRFMQLLLYGTNSSMRKRNVLSAYAIGLTLMPDEYRNMAYKEFNKIVNTGSDLLYFMAYTRNLGRGVGKGLRRAISRWYNGRDFDQIDYQLAKYTSRQGFHHRDVIRLAHPAPNSDELSAVFKYLLRGGTPPSFSRFHHIERLSQVDNLNELMEIVIKHNLSWEMIPTNPWHKMPEFWERMLDHLPWNAFLRHLRRYINYWIAEKGEYAGFDKAIERLDKVNKEKLHVHPGRILDAHIALVDLRIEKVTEALKGAFFRGFERVKPTDISIGIGTDTSGSMFYAALFDKAIAINATLEKAIKNTETVFFKSNAYIPKLTMSISDLAFAGPFPINAHKLRRLGIKPGHTNAASVIEHFLEKGSRHDAIVIITDEETWLGKHPSRVFEKYQKRVNPNAKLVVITLSPAGRPMTDPSKADQVTVVGWTPDIAKIVVNFARF